MTEAESGAELGRVVDWLEGRLDPSAAASMQQRLDAGDRDLAASVAWVRTFRSAAALRNEPVPDGLARRLRELRPAPAIATAEASSPGWLERFVGTVRASITFDSLTSPGLAMARSAADLTRQLVFSVDGLDVALDLAPDDAGRVAVGGQLLPLDQEAAAAGVAFSAWGSDGLLVEGRSDDRGLLDLGLLPVALVVVDISGTSDWPPVHAELDLRA